MYPTRPVLDDGQGEVINWEPDDLAATIWRAAEAGWPVLTGSDTPRPPCATDED